MNLLTIKEKRSEPQFVSLRTRDQLITAAATALIVGAQSLFSDVPELKAQLIKIRESQDQQKTATTAALETNRVIVEKLILEMREVKIKIEALQVESAKAGNTPQGARSSTTRGL